MPLTVRLKITFQSQMAVWSFSTKAGKMSLVLPREGTFGEPLAEYAPPAGEPIRAFQEVFKYALKFSQLPIPLNYQVANQLQGCRLLVSFGDFWGTKVPEKLTDDPLEQDYVEYLYEWIDREYRLQGVRHVEMD